MTLEMYISALCGVLQGEMKGMQMIVYFSVCSSIDIDDSCFVYRNIVLRLMCIGISVVREEIEFLNELFS